MILNHNGVRLRVQVFGQRNNRPPLVFLNGFHISYETWIFQIPPFTKNFFVVCYDQRGAGDSDKPIDEAAYSFDNFPTELRFIVEELNLGTIMPIGFSVSCKTAVKYAVTYPNEVSKLVLTCGNPSLTRSVNQADLLTFIQNNYEEAMRSFMRRCLPEPNTEWQNDLLVTLALNSNPFVAVSVLKNYYKDDIEPLLSKISLPTLIMHGDKDDVYPIERAYRFHKLIPGSVLHVHKGKGHVPNLTDIEAYNTIVEGFLMQESRYYKRN